MKVLLELERIGYRVHMQEDRIRLSYMHPGGPDHKAVRPLLEEVREKKSEAIRYLELHEEMDQRLNSVKEKYRKTLDPGFLQQIHHSELHSEITRTEQELHETRRKVLAGAISIDVFKDVLADWEDRVQQTIQEQRTPAATGYADDLGEKSIGSFTPSRSMDGTPTEPEEVPSGWGKAMRSLISWFLSADLPTEPFTLHKGQQVTNTAKFFNALQQDVQMGPNGPRAECGTLKKDLQALRTIFDDQTG